MTTDRFWVDEMAIWKERCDFRLFGIMRVMLSPHKAWFTFFAFVKGQDAAHVCPLTLDWWQRGGAVRPNPSWGRAPPTREIPGVCLTGRSQSLHSYQVLSFLSWETDSQAKGQTPLWNEARLQSSFLWPFRQTLTVPSMCLLKYIHRKYN